MEASLTDEGARLIDEILGVRREGFRAVLDALTDAELSDLHRLLGRVIAAGAPLVAEQSATDALGDDRRAAEHLHIGGEPAAGEPR